MNARGLTAASAALGSDVDTAPAAVQIGVQPAVPTPNLILIGGASGVLAGVLELAYATGVSSSQPAGSELVLLAVTSSLLGFCGMLYGAVLLLLNTAAGARFAPWAKLLVVAIAGTAAAARYRPFDAAVISGALLGGIAWSWWRGSGRGGAILFVWACLLYVLSPLFNGHAMDRVFTDIQATALFFVVVGVLPVLALALLPASHAGRGAPRAALVKATVATAIAATLTVCSSMFLIRLWGFNTMAYLEGTLLVLKIGCLATSLTAVAAYWPATAWSRPRRETNLLAVLALLILFVASAYTGMRHDPQARLLLAQLPDTSFVANAIGDLLDRDHDGYSAAFGFGDCDDTNPNIAPGAIDWPGDGIDENCFGGDLKSVAHGYFNRGLSADPPPASDTTPARRKVVVFVLVDTLRADAVDYGGGADSVTPEIAKLARHSLRFDRAYAQSNNTLESMPFLMHLGFRDLPRYDERLALPSQFRAGGVASVGVFQAPPRFWFSELDDIFMGFDAKLFPDAQTRYRTPEGTATLALERLRAHQSDAPLFLYVHFESLHDSFTQLMEGDRLRHTGVNLSEVVRLWNMRDMVALMKQRYLTALSSVDHAVGMLFDGIHDLEASTDVLFIVTADHGEEFYDHGGLFHMGTLHEELVRVPLLLYQTAGTPRIEETPVGLYRVPPTLLKWLGYRGEFLDDMNLLHTPVSPFEIFGYFSFGGEWERRSFMIVEDGYKLIYDAGRGRLEMFNLTADPHEMHNLVGVPQEHDREQRLVAKMDTTMFFMNYGDVEYARLMQARAASFP
jgi:arylsulfatase A-like enzyme